MEAEFQIINQMPFPVEVCDPLGKTLMVNKVFLDTFEVPPAGRIMRQLETLGRSEVLGNLRGGEKITLDLAVEPGELARTYSSGRKGGAIFEITMYPVTSPHGEVVHVVAIWRDVTERRQAEVNVRASLQEKELLLKEVHHRVKNNLQVVSSLLSLQGESIKDPPSRRAFREARDRVRSMASIHEMLYQSGDLARIDFSGYISNLASQLFSSHNVNPERVKLQIDVEPVSLGINLGVPCGLLINELMTNALKHAFPGGRAGTIMVGLKEMPDHSIRLAVRDNGIGLSPDIDVSAADSLGFQLITTLVSQLNATLEVRRDGGTEFVILF